MTGGEVVVRSRHTVFSVGRSAGAIATSMAFLVLVSGLWVPLDDSVVIVVGEIVCVLFFAWGGLIGLTGRYWVSLAGIGKRDVFGHRTVEWSAVEKIQVNPDFFGGFSLDVCVRGSQRMLVRTNLVGNRDEVAKAVVEAATTANPRLVLIGWWADVYGNPPFGVFQPEQRETGAGPTKSSATR